MFNLKKISLLIATGFISQSLGVVFENYGSTDMPICFLTHEGLLKASFMLRQGERINLDLDETPSIRRTTSIKIGKGFKIDKPNDNATTITISSSEKTSTELVDANLAMRLRIHN